jgi:uncharacterized membrane protein
MESGVAGGASCGTVYELIDCVVVIGVGGVASTIFTSEQVANFVVGIGKLGTVVPGFFVVWLAASMIKLDKYRSRYYVKDYRP